MHLTTLYRDIDRVLDKMYQPAYKYNAPLLVRTDVREIDSSYVFEIDLPGYELNQISGEIVDGVLVVSAKREESNEGTYLRHERYNECYVNYALPKNTDHSTMRANYKNGVLVVTVNKSADNSRKLLIEG